MALQQVLELLVPLVDLRHLLPSVGLLQESMGHLKEQFWLLAGLGLACPGFQTIRKGMEPPPSVWPLEFGQKCQASFHRLL
jgi:hypothetical protein